MPFARGWLQPFVWGKKRSLCRIAIAREFDSRSVCLGAVSVVLVVANSVLTGPLTADNRRGSRVRNPRSVAASVAH